MRIDERCLFESNIRDRFHRLGCPVSLAGRAESFRSASPIVFHLLRVNPEINFTITLRSFYTTHMITCQRFFDANIIFFERRSIGSARTFDRFASRVHRRAHTCLLIRRWIEAPSNRSAWNRRGKGRKRERVSYRIFLREAGWTEYLVPGVGLEPTWGASPEGF